MQAKNTVVFGLSKNRRAKTESNVNYGTLASGWCSRLQSAGVLRKCSQEVENKLGSRKVKMAADGTFLGLCDPLRS